MLTGRLSGGSRVTSRPRSSIVPLVGRSKPPIIRRVVVLPQPDGPRSEKNSPVPIVSETSSTARTSRYSFVRLASRISGWGWREGSGDAELTVRRSVPEPGARTRRMLGGVAASVTPGLVVALDGPASSGKSSVGAAAAAELGYRFCDTGLLYRAVTWLALDRGLKANDASGLSTWSTRSSWSTTAVDGSRASRSTGSIERTRCAVRRSTSPSRRSPASRSSGWRSSRASAGSQARVAS